MALDESNLEESGPLGYEMTWIGRNPNGVIMEKLDRGFRNREWSYLFPDAEIKALSWWCSDHKPLMASISILSSSYHCRFKKRNTRFQKRLGATKLIAGI